MFISILLGAASMVCSLVVLLAFTRRPLFVFSDFALFLIFFMINAQIAGFTLLSAGCFTLSYILAGFISVQFRTVRSNLFFRFHNFSDVIIDEENTDTFS